MENVTYRAYRRNPDLRQQLEREARRAQRAEMDRLIVAPLARWIARTLGRAGSTPTCRRHEPA